MSARDIRLETGDVGGLSTGVRGGENKHPYLHVTRSLFGQTLANDNIVGCTFYLFIRAPRT